MLVAGVFLLVWASMVLLILALNPIHWRKRVAWMPPIGGLATMLLFGNALLPGERLLLSTVGMLYLLKGAILLRRSAQDVRGFDRWGLLLYLSVWPGMNPAPFRTRQPNDVNDGTPFVRGVVRAGCGVAGIVLLSLVLPFLPTNLAGMLGIAALLLTVHFGYAEALPWLLRWAGYAVPPLFDAPLQSVTLTEFWSRRWNRAFVEMNQILFLRPLHRRLGAAGAAVGVFAVSGILHEMAISYPAGRGWGGPLAYFVLHGLLVLLESRWKAENWSRTARSLWTWSCLLVPLPILFHAPFRQTCILPLFQTLHQLLTSVSLEWYFDKALWLAGIGHFCILGASFQVPFRLGWKEDFSKLTRFNRKIFWTYSGYIVLCIVSLGIMTLVLHDEMLRGDKAALCLAGFATVFWVLRLLTDFFYFKHDDWPRGPQFVVGHTLLTALFCALASVYTGVIVYHLLR